MADTTDFDGLGIITSSSKQPIDDINYAKSLTVSGLKKQLLYQLNENANQIQMISDLNTAFVKQQSELLSRIRELDLIEGDEISQELNDKLTEFEKGSKALNETIVNVLKEFLMTPAGDTSTSTTEMTDITQILTVEIRHLQAQLQEKDQRIKKLERSKAKLNRFSEQLNKTLQTHQEYEKQFKEENPTPNFYGPKVRHEKNMINNPRNISTFNKEKLLRTQSEISVCSSRIKNDQTPQNPDPNIIHMIAKTLIGDYLWKYTRNNFWSRKRHKRFFWIHPYTNILYWSKENPATYEFDTYIDYVREIINDDYSSPDLYHTSLVITTPEGDMEITTQTKEQHECWFQALRYLHQRSADAGLNQIPTSLSVELLNNDSDYFCDDDGDSDDLKNMRQCCNGRHDISKLERAPNHNRFIL
ncbi:5747_t:CDS:2 [Racocetra fulgida]|uniref:5747_t:CDS:1 n=1 Tax=Racocetra fulgida TaxID=60492 RepID=A0A9N9AMB0_9GLOM|nr:5747_t:CDS:2 [Racocetra fulgida]